MAPSSPLTVGSPSFLRLEQSLETPEPMCLVVVAVPDGIGALDVVESRIRSQLRSYDQLWPVDDCSFAIVIKTLADPTAMEIRLRRLFDGLSEPLVAGAEPLKVLAGGSVRLPGDTAATLLARVDQALGDGADNGYTGPVMI